MPPAISAYAAGLSQFPDESVLYSDTYGLGGITDILNLVPGGSALAPLLALTGGGSAVDAQRQSRTQYFYNKAANENNVAAAQVLLGGQVNTASHEKPYYDSAVSQLQASTQGRAVLQAAQALGPYWSTSDTATNYPAMRSFVANWASQNSPLAPVLNATGAIAGPVINAARTIPSVVWLGAAVIGGVLLLAPRRGR